MKNLLKGIGFCLLFSHVATAQFSLEYEYRLNGTKTREVFNDQRQVIQDSSALVYRGSRRIIFGVIMSEDGYILTKASEIEEPKVEHKPEGEPVEIKPLTVRLGENVLFEEVEVIAVDATWDIALLKVDAKGLKPIELAESSEISQGSWVFTNGASSRDRRRVKAGIVSAKSREIPGPAPVLMGVGLEEKDEKLFIKGVSEGGAADLAGLLSGDQILMIDETKIDKRDELIDVLMGKKPDDIVKIKVMREGAELKIDLTLKARPTANRSPSMNKNDAMSGRFSRRRDSFPRVLQVDIPMEDRSCGGPLINLAGKCLGIVIARANRAETFAVPVEEMKEIYERMSYQKASE